ncbi:MAG: formate dehydrogenase accessory sulfurtransferase FdhD [Puniceicoccaceae bacterium]|nr:MAG: formate dehydrogenase accessory sulfurtransferase FdhD [Puniceicoccaceae bacterium]
MPPSPEPEPAAASGTILRRSATGAVATARDQLAVEEPLELRLGGNTLAVTMRTPGHDEELAAGFLATEGLLRSRSDLLSARPCHESPHPENTLVLTLATRPDLGPSARYGTIHSSCGVCGRLSIDTLRSRYPDLHDNRTTVEEATLLALPGQLRSAQAAFEQTGGLHAAGIFSASGELLALREDVGRHNAVDKALGRLLLDGRWPLPSCLLLVSGRVSFEIVQKALTAGIPLVAALSAPSTLAVATARETGQSLVAFLRPPTFNVYAHPQRIRFSTPEP